LERIGAAMKQRWGLEEENGKEESGDEEGDPRMAPGKVRRKELCYLPPIRLVALFFSLFNRIFLFFVI